MAPPDPLLESRSSIHAGSWSSDGTYIAFSSGEPRQSLWVLPTQGPSEPTLVLDATRAEALLNVAEPAFSPDTRWIAYQNDERGSIEVVAFPGASQRHTVSEGRSPVWHPNGGETVFPKRRERMSASIETEPDFKARTPNVLFEDPRIRRYDVAPDGESFFVVRLPEGSAPTELDVFLIWHNELNRLVPPGN